MKHGWEYTTFENVIKPAKVDRCKDRTDLPILSITMRSGIVFQNDRFQKTIASKDTSDYKIVKDGQLVIAFPIDEGLIYTQDVADEGIMSPAYNIWNVDYSRLNRKFLNLYFHCPWAMNYYKSKLRGTTQRRRMIPKEDLLSMPIPIPPLPIQERIVSELDCINGILEKKREQIKELDALAQSIFYDMFGDPIQNEKGWEVKKLGEVAEIIGGSTPKTNDASYWNGEYFWITPAELDGRKYFYSTSRTLTDDGVKSANLQLLPIGTVLLSSRAPIGKVAITCAPMYCNQGFKNIVCSDRLNNEYVYSFLLYNNDYLNSLGTGATFKEISKRVVSEIPIPLPPLSLQQAFAAKIEAIEKQKELVKRSIAETETLLASRMQHYFEA